MKGRACTARSLGYNFDIPRALQLMNHSGFDPGFPISGFVLLNETVDALAGVGSGPTEHTKVLVSLERK